MTGLRWKNRLFFFGFGLSMLMLIGCSSNKYLQPGEAFLEENNVRIKSDVRVKNKGALKNGLANQYRQPATRTFFGIPRHWFYYRTIDNPDSTWLKSWVQRKIAEPPVIYDSLLAVETSNLMTTFLRQQGYWNADVTFETRIDRRRATVTYTADPMRRWTVKSITYNSTDTAIQRILNDISDESLLAPGEPVDVDIYEAERRRIAREMQNRGYANFVRNYVSYPIADSSDLTMELEIDLLNPPEGARHQKYTIGTITVYPDFTNTDTNSIDTVISGVRFISSGDRLLVKPDIILRHLYFNSGELYTRDNYDKSLRQLSKLDTYKFVTIKPRVDPDDTSVLNYEIILTRNKKMGIGGDIEFNYSTLSLAQRNLMGLGLNFNYRNRNIFRGAELFQTNIETGIEFNLSSLGDRDSLINSLNVSVQNSLLIPKFIAPIGAYRLANEIGILGDRTFEWITEGTTTLTGGYQFLSLFNLYSYQSVNASLGYDARPDPKRRLQLNHIGIDYFSPSTRPAFDTILSDNRFLQESFGKQLFTGVIFRDYRFIYNGLPNAAGLSFSFIHSAEVSGLEVLAINSIYNEITGKTGEFSIGSENPLQFSHFAKFEVDTRLYQQISSTQQLAFRFSAGMALSFGPYSSQVPYVKQFYLGGPLSIRAWQIRELGPGGYDDPNVNPDRNLPFYQAGDVKLEASAEYRFDIGWIFKGAFFVDAGNIWTIKTDPDRPGAGISWNFLDQIAVGTGFGLRMDFDYFLIRLDLGYKLRNPFPDPDDPKGRQWLFHRFSDFSFDQFNTNFAIGYPF